MKMRKGLSMIELLLVVTIIGILATLSISGFVKTRARAYDRKLVSQLVMIYAAEKVMRIDGGAYVNCNSGTPCPGALGLSLDTGSGWDYCVKGNATGFCASARHRYGTTNSISNSSDVIMSGNCSPTCL
jgi:prepilin-type N-terminal cleavage/methylation domain-containing protein